MKTHKKTSLQKRSTLSETEQSVSFNITFSPEGLGNCLYTDHIDLQALGLLTMQRASNIEWNDVKQLWQVIEASTQKILYSNKSRKQCIDWEIKHFNQ